MPAPSLQEGHRTTEESIRRGRRIVRLLIIAILTVSLSVIGLYVAAVGTGKLPTQVTRFVLTAALCWWLYRGSNAARWILIVLLGLGGLAGMASALTSGPALMSVVIVGTSLGGVYAVSAAVLLGSSSVEGYLAHRRRGAVRLAMRTPPSRPT